MDYYVAFPHDYAGEGLERGVNPSPRYAGERVRASGGEGDLNEGQRPWIAVHGTAYVEMTREKDWSNASYPSPR